jgi:hypothetical protein
MTALRFLVALLTAATALPAAAAECSARSGAAPAALVELYTSEGCNSCPPADRWFSQLAVAGGSVVPLAFHVDYWDHLGWKDRFASRAWSERQREAVRRSGARYAYTPQVMRNGRDFPRWSRSGSLAEAASGDGPAGASIALSVQSSPASVTVTAEAVTLAPGAAGARLLVAVTESGLATQVKAGENRGERLAHDHVVRALADLGPVGEAIRPVRSVFAPGRDWNREALAVVAFVQDARSGAVLQALRLSCPP